MDGITSVSATVPMGPLSESLEQKSGLNSGSSTPYLSLSASSYINPPSVPEQKPNVNSGASTPYISLSVSSYSYPPSILSNKVILGLDFLNEKYTRYRIGVSNKFKLVRRKYFSASNTIVY